MLKREISSAALVYAVPSLLHIVADGPIRGIKSICLF
jgi:hypothetical protein